MEERRGPLSPRCVHMCGVLGTDCTRSAGLPLSSGSPAAKPHSGEGRAPGYDPLLGRGDYRQPLRPPSPSQPPIGGVSLHLQFLVLHVLRPGGRCTGMSRARMCLWSTGKYLGTRARYHGSTSALELEAKRGARNTSGDEPCSSSPRQPGRADIASCSRHAPNLDGEQRCGGGTPRDLRVRGRVGGGEPRWSPPAPSPSCT